MTVCRDIEAPAERVIRSLDMNIEWRGKPNTIRVDNGPEYISGKLLIWVIPPPKCGAA
jgi:putative transposase